jgi:hypothetical protein
MSRCELFKDEELQKLIRTALQENLELRVAAAAVQEFRINSTFPPADDGCLLLGLYLPWE